MTIKMRLLAAVAALGTIAAMASGGKKTRRIQPLPVQAMPHRQESRAPMTIKLRTLVILAVLALLGAAGFVYFGIYNIAATSQHTAPVYHLLHYAMTRSVSVRADDIQTPDLSHPVHIRKGFVLYREHCLQCHGAPGVAPDPVGFGTRPAPVNLVEASRDWRPAEVYWVVKHGIKMTAMAAWKYRLTEEELWDLTAFVKVLPEISPKEYKDWDRSTPTPPTPPAPISNSAALGNAEEGKHALQQYLCITCHSIPGVTGANTNVGPPLEGMANRKYIGGVLVNTPENMIRWLRDPQAIDPLSGMPNLRIKEKDIRDIAAYLYTLKDPAK